MGYKVTLRDVAVKDFDLLDGDIQRQAIKQLEGIRKYIQYHRERERIPAQLELLGVLVYCEMPHLVEEELTP